MLSKTIRHSIDTRSRLKLFIIIPMARGVQGFIFFFVVILLLKILQNAINPSMRILIESEDALLAMLGFILLFLIALLKNFQEDSYGRKR